MTARRKVRHVRFEGEVCGALVRLFGCASGDSNDAVFCAHDLLAALQVPEAEHGPALAVQRSALPGCLSIFMTVDGRVLLGITYTAGMFMASEAAKHGYVPRTAVGELNMIIIRNMCRRWREEQAG